MSANHSRANQLLQAGRFDLAEREFREAQKRDPENAVIIAGLAHCLALLKRYEAATAQANRALMLDPNQELAHLALLQTYQDTGKPAEALTKAKDIVRIKPTTSYYRGVMAMCHLHCSHWKEAASAARSGLELDAADELCLGALSRAEAFLGDKERSLVIGQNVLQNNAESALAHEVQGWNYLHARDIEKAKHHFGEALRISPLAESAKQGMSQAMMSGSFLLGRTLPALWWVQRLTSRRFWTLTFGLYSLAAVLRTILEQFSTPAILGIALWVIYAGCVLLLWFVYPVLRIGLAFGRYTRHLLEPRERPFLRLFGGILMAGAMLTPIWLPKGHLLWLLAGLIGVYVTIPLNATFTPPSSKRS